MSSCEPPIDSIQRAATLIEIRQLVDLSGIDTTYLDDDGIQHDLLDTLQDRTPTVEEASTSGRSRARRAAVKVIVSVVAAGIDVRKVADALASLAPAFWGELGQSINKAKKAAQENPEEFDQTEEIERVLASAHLGVQEMTDQARLRYEGKKPKARHIKWSWEPDGESTRVAMVMPKTLLATVKFRLGPIMEEVGPADVFTFITADQLLSVTQALARGYDVTDDLWQLTVRAARNHPVQNAIYQMIEKTNGATFQDIDQVMLYSTDELDQAVKTLKRIGLITQGSQETLTIVR